jgi:hypothetical protein
MPGRAAQARFSDGQQLGTWDHNSKNPTVTLPQFPVPLAEKGENPRIGVVREIVLDEFFHVEIVAGFGMRMDFATPGVPSQISVEYWADVIQFVENGNQFLFKRLIQKTGQAKREQVEHFPVVDEETLHLIFERTVSANQCAMPEPHRR